MVHVQKRYKTWTSYSPVYVTLLPPGRVFFFFTSGGRDVRVCEKILSGYLGLLLTIFKAKPLGGVPSCSEAPTAREAHLHWPQPGTSHASPSPPCSAPLGSPPLTVPSPWKAQPQTLVTIQTSAPRSAPQRGLWYLSARSAKTEDHKPLLLSPCPGGWKSEVKESAGPAPPKASVFGVWTALSSRVLAPSSLCARLCPDLFLQGPHLYWVRATSTASFNLHHLFKDRTSHHILRSWGSEFNVQF